MKTIALKERTFEILMDLKNNKKSKSFDELIVQLVIDKKGLPESMFGSLKGKLGKFTSKDRKEMWEDDERP